MKRIKYTNTGVTPLSVIRTSDKGHHIFDDTKNGILSVYVIKLRNHSKNDSAKSKVIFDGKQYVFESSKESILAEISNAYLFWMLKFKNPELFLKFFETYKSPHFMLMGYVGKCAIHKLVKDDVIK